MAYGAAMAVPAGETASGKRGAAVEVPSPPPHDTVDRVNEENARLRDVVVQMSGQLRELNAVIGELPTYDALSER